MLQAILGKFLLPDSGECHEAPPERVEEGPGAGWVILLCKVDEGGKGEHCHPHEEHEESELLVRLVEGVYEGL